jgi:hypothetical protein
MTIFLFVAISVEASVRFPGEANEGGQHVRNFVAREAGGHEKPSTQLLKPSEVASDC